MMRGRAPKSLKTSLVDLAARRQLHAFRKCNGNARLVGSQGSTETYPRTTRTCITRLGYFPSCQVPAARARPAPGPQAQAECSTIGFASSRPNFVPTLASGTGAVTLEPA